MQQNYWRFLKWGNILHTHNLHHGIERNLISWCREHRTNYLTLNICIWQVIYCGKQGSKSLRVPKSIHNTNDILTHWGRVTHICVSKLTIIASDNGLSPGWRQAIIWTNDGILYWILKNKLLIKILTFSFKKMHLKIPSATWRPFCLGLNVLMNVLDEVNLTSFCRWCNNPFLDEAI